MKITKSQLRKIIREAILREAADDMSMYDDITKAPLHMPPRPDKRTEFRSQADRDSEYNLGKEDSLAGREPQSSGKDYMRGYNEAQLGEGLLKELGFKTPDDIDADGVRHGTGSFKGYEYHPAYQGFTIMKTPDKPQPRGGTRRGEWKAHRVDYGRPVNFSQNSKEDLTKIIDRHVKMKRGYQGDFLEKQGKKNS